MIHQAVGIPIDFLSGDGKLANPLRDKMLYIPLKFRIFSHTLSQVALSTCYKFISSTRRYFMDFSYKPFYWMQKVIFSHLKIEDRSFFTILLIWCKIIKFLHLYNFCPWLIIHAIFSWLFCSLLLLLRLFLWMSFGEIIWWMLMVGRWLKV